jgi:hypothetical protein
LTLWTPTAPDTVLGVSQSESRFGPGEPLSVSDIEEETSEGRPEWCFSVNGLDDTVQAARFATRREAEKAHRRFQRAIELLGRKPAS